MKYITRRRQRGKHEERKEGAPWRSEKKNKVGDRKLLSTVDGMGCEIGKSTVLWVVHRFPINSQKTTGGEKRKLEKMRTPEKLPEEENKFNKTLESIVVRAHPQRDSGLHL